MSFANSQFENRQTQRLKRDGLFNHPERLVEAWYPICSVRKLPKGAARSFLILNQRVVVWRTKTGALHCTDAFCPHMGADLGNGNVIGERLRCYFHHWQFDGDGQLVERPCSKQALPKIKLRHYPVQEHLGFIWVYAGEKAASPLIVPPELDGMKLSPLHIASVDLYAHHHVMFAGGIDLQHFSTVHKVNIDFVAHEKDQGQNIREWQISGEIAPTSWRGRLGRWMIGPRFTYCARLGAGSMFAITYGYRQKFMGRFWTWPTLHIVWGCQPRTDGTSRVEVFSVTARRSRFRNLVCHLFTLALLLFLKDDDVKAFPNMRFQVDHPMPEDHPVLQLIHFINQLPESKWTQIPLNVSLLSTGSQTINLS